MASDSHLTSGCRINRNGIWSAARRTLVLALFLASLLATPFATLLGGTARAATLAGVTEVAVEVGKAGEVAVSIPIAVAPGTAGMQPSLALTYNSRGGNGTLGQGWSLSGLSSIQRCGQTLAEDNASTGVHYDASKDRFCLDGQRLKLISGTYGADGSEYRTALDGFAKITAHGSAGSGPQRFEVRTKDGLVMHFGSVWHGRIEAPGTSEVRVWAVNRIQDVTKNVIDITYFEAGGNLRLDKIYYGENLTTGQNAYATVRFFYETRPDPMVAYLGGHAIATDHRLTAIKSYYLSNDFREYRLTYGTVGLTGRSQPTAVTECVPSGDCLAPVSFENSPGGDAVFTRNAITTPAIPIGYSRMAGGDFDGDGIGDLLIGGLNDAGNKENPTSDRLWLGDGSGGFQETVLSVGASVPEGLRVVAQGDINGDGRTDLYLFPSDDYRRRLGNSFGDDRVWLGQADGSFQRMILSSSHEVIDDHAVVATGDFNGDKRLDLFSLAADEFGRKDGAAQDGLYLAQNNGSFLRSTVPVSSHGEQVVATGDFNGDGLTDLYLAGTNTYGHKGLTASDRIAFSNGDGSFTTMVRPVAESIPEHYQVSGGGDFNGDGLSDLLLVFTDNSGRHLGGLDYLWLNRGDGSFESINLGSSGHLASYAVVGGGDLNGDGLADLVWMWVDAHGRKRACTDPTWGPGDGYSDGQRVDASEYFWLGQPDGGFLELERDADPHQPYSSVWGQGDYDGDGLTDSVLATVNTLGQRANLGVWFTGTACKLEHDAGSTTEWFFDQDLVHSDSQVQGLVTKVTTSLGAETAITYSTLASAAGYVTYDDAVYPAMELNGPFTVVEQVERDDGLGGVATTLYDYAGARVDLQGRGFLGFRSLRATDLQTGNHTLTTYRQDYPFAGRVASSTASWVDTATMTALTNTWASLSLNGGKSLFPYLAQKSEQSFEPNDGPGNSPIRTVQTAFAYDSFGNALTVTATTSGVNPVSLVNETFVTTTTSSYGNDTGKWHLGRLTESAVTKTRPGGASETRASAFTYDPATGLLTSEIIEPVSADELVTTYGYDAYGNILTTTVSGPGIATRTSSNQMDSRGRFLYRSTNPLGHQETQQVDPFVGAVTELTGPNDLTTTWDYDQLGRKLEEARADGTRTTWDYLRCGVGISCPAGGVYAVRQRQWRGTVENAGQAIDYFDKLNRVFRSESEGFDGTPVYVDTLFNARGLVEKVSRPYFMGDSPLWTTTTYDDSGRGLTVTAPDGGVSQSLYQGLKVCATDAKGHQNWQYRNAIGELVRVIDDAGSFVTYEYDALGNLVRTVDPLGAEILISYDIRGNKIAMTDPVMGTWSYQHNVLGELTQQTDAKGQSVTLTYDLLGRLVSRVEPEGSTSWIYDEYTSGPVGASIGQILEESGPGVEKRYIYDSLGRLGSSTSIIEGSSYTVSRTYDPDGRLARLTYPSGFRISHDYNALGYLEDITEVNGAGTVYWRADAMNAEGQVTAETLGNGMLRYRDFDPETGLPARIEAWKGGSLRQELAFEFDLVGNLMAREDLRGDRRETFGYDSLNRLTSHQLSDTGTGGSLGSGSIAYDAVGNITSKVTSGPLGPVSTGAGPHAIVWSSFHKPTQIDNATSGEGVTFLYGPDRARVRQTILAATGLTTVKYVEGLYEHHVIDGAADEKHHFIRAGATVAILKYLGDGATPTSEETGYLLKDHLGSIVAIADEAGTLVEELSYDPWGRRRLVDWQPASGQIFAQETRRGFTGHEMLDVVGLVHMNGRVYDPGLGRFLSPDPFVQIPESTQGFNRYAYVNNNPLSFSDPSGFFFKKLFSGFKNFMRTALPAIAFGVIAAVAGPLGLAVAAVYSGFQALSYGGNFGDFAMAVGLTLGNAGLTYGIGSLAGALAKASVELAFVVQTVAHGVVQGVYSELRGSSFLSGFVAGAVANLAVPFIRALPTREAQTIVGALVGGTASKIGGGKFANGAISGAIVYLTAPERELSPEGELQPGDIQFAQRTKTRGITACTATSALAPNIGCVQGGNGAMPRGSLQTRNSSAETPVTGTYSVLKGRGLKDAHHVIQHAAVKNVPGYKKGAAPAVQLPGPSTNRGSPHYNATQVQRQSGGGTYGAERRIGYKALRRAGLNPDAARAAIRESDSYFQSIGVSRGTILPRPGNRPY